MSARRILCLAVFVSCVCPFAAAPGIAEDTSWKRVEVWRGGHVNTAVGGDFTGDGLPDVIGNSGGRTFLLVAPDWKSYTIADDREHAFIHSELFDVDDDSDLDFIAARYKPGLVVWFECPDDPLAGPWKMRIIDDEVDGVHGLLQGDVDRDGKLDLLANSAQPAGSLPNSAVWLKAPAHPRTAERWTRHVVARGDAPGLSHYFGFGDVNGDGRPDVSLAAKGGPQAAPGAGEWFAWWEAPADPTWPWRKHVIAEHEPGATNIMPADVNGDGQCDFIATRGHGEGVVWFEGPTWRLHVIHPTLREPHSLAVADLDGDGDIDAATCAYGDKIAAWFENDGKGRFMSHVISNDQAAYDIRAVDMDRDGDLDLLIAGQQSQNIVWCANPLR